jgi:hypothetical protein
VEYEPRRIRGGSASRIFWALLRGGSEVRPWVLLREALHLRTMEDAEHDDVCVIEAIEDPITIFRFDENIHARLVGALAETREVSKACNRRSEVCDDIAFTDGRTFEEVLVQRRELRERAPRVPYLHKAMRL